MSTGRAETQHAVAIRFIELHKRHRVVRQSKTDYDNKSWRLNKRSISAVKTKSDKPNREHRRERTYNIHGRTVNSIKHTAYLKFNPLFQKLDQIANFLICDSP